MTTVAITSKAEARKAKKVTTATAPASAANAKLDIIDGRPTHDSPSTTPLLGQAQQLPPSVSSSHQCARHRSSHSMTAVPQKLLIASIGNPPPYLSTLHSAGHIVLHALRARLRADALVSYTPFVRSRALGNGLVSTAASGNDGPWTLWQSGAAMNESGGGVRAAWSAWARDNRDGRLVVLYDELEMALGGVKVRGGSASARGHNGIKSILGAGLQGSDLVRVAIGIGRPASREPAEVAAYVLRKVTPKEKAVLEGETTEQVLRVLNDLSRR